MTCSGRKWRLIAQNTNKPLIVRLLANRGINNQRAADDFFASSLEEESYASSLLPGLSDVVKRIKQAKKRKESVMIHGDYDADGISATALLYQCLHKDFGIERCLYWLPSRFGDGYGLSEKIIHKFANDGIKLLIAVDCGTTDVLEIDLAGELGIDVIVIDHHVPGKELPKALALINPKLENSKYKHPSPCATGLVFKLAQAMVPEKANGYLDLAALATVVDCVPLLAENRAIVKEGLALIRRQARPGIRSLLAKTMRNRDDINAISLAYRAGPTINVAGRLGDPGLAINLLLAESDQEADKITDQLIDLNKKRQKLTEEALQEARALINPDDKIIAIKSPKFLSGIAGIIAARLLEATGKPAIVAEEGDEHCVGSCRAMPGFELTDLLTSQADKLLAFGGHSGAAGFTIKNENWEVFVRHIQSLGAAMFDGIDFCPVLELDCELLAEELDWPLISLLKRFAPFGTGNKEPVFLLRDVTVISLRFVGDGNKHLKFKLRLGGRVFDGIAFGADQWADKDKIQAGDTLDIACRLQENIWQETRSIQLQILDIGGNVMVEAAELTKQVAVSA